MDFELSSEFSRIQAIPHFTIFAKKSESTRLWFQETLGTKQGYNYEENRTLIPRVTTTMAIQGTLNFGTLRTRKALLPPHGVV